jgi:uncharacterized membrane protein YkvA (DUF1232 family)
MSVIKDLLLPGPVKRIGLLAALWRNVRLSWRLVRDPRVAFFTKAVPFAVLAVYFVSPLGWLQAVPVLGEVDDLAALALALSLLIRLAPDSVVSQYRAEMA